MKASTERKEVIRWVHLAEHPVIGYVTARFAQLHYAARWRWVGVFSPL